MSGNNPIYCSLNLSLYIFICIFGAFDYQYLLLGSVFCSLSGLSIGLDALLSLHKGSVVGVGMTQGKKRTLASLMVWLKCHK